MLLVLISKKVLRLMTQCQYTFVITMTLNIVPRMPVLDSFIF